MCAASCGLFAVWACGHDSGPAALYGGMTLDDPDGLGESLDRYRSALLYSLHMMSEVCNMAKSLVPTDEDGGAIAEDQEMYRGPIGDGLLRLCDKMLADAFDGYSAYDVPEPKIRGVHDSFKEAFWAHDKLLDDHICIQDSAMEGLECDCIKCTQAE